LSKDDGALPALPSQARRKTWQPRGAIDSDDEDATFSPVDIPDYVINFLRGETPESIARRKREKRRISGARALDARHFDQSSISDLSSPRSPPASADDEQYILPAIPEKLGRQRSWRSLTHGWRGGIALNAILGLVVILASIICVILLVTKSGTEEGPGLYTIFESSCTTSSQVNWALRALMSAIAISLLAAANYAFQVLSSPTRAEVNLAHSRRRWLDIGIPSIRNFFYISNERAFYALLVTIAAITTQLM
jgi:hypothetical protein